MTETTTENQRLGRTVSTIMVKETSSLDYTVPGFGDSIWYDNVTVGFRGPFISVLYNTHSPSGV